jgi:hypothetical protein
MKHAELLLLILYVLQQSCGPDEKRTSGGKQRGNLSESLRISWRIEGDDDILVDKKTVDAIAREKFIRLKPPAAGTQRVRLNGEMSVVEKQGALVLEGRISVPGIPFPVVTRVAATGSAADNAAAVQMITDGVADIVSAFSALLPLVDATSVVLIKSLDAAEPDVQVLAAKLIALKKTPRASPALCPLLSDPREAVAEAAGEALIALADPASVPCVIGSVSRESLRSEVRAIEILGHVGSAEAIAYLEMIAGGHELKEVRLLSETLLKRLKKSTTGVAQNKTD